MGKKNKTDMFIAVQDYLEENPPEEDPILRNIEIKKGHKLYVDGKCGAITGNYGTWFYLNLKYDIVDHDIKIYK